MSVAHTKVMDTLAKDIALFEELKKVVDSLLSSKSIIDKQLIDRFDSFSKTSVSSQYPATLLGKYLKAEEQSQRIFEENKKLVSLLQGIVRDLKELRDRLRANKTGDYLGLYRATVRPCYETFKKQVMACFTGRLGGLTTRMNALTSLMSACQSQEPPSKQLQARLQKLG